MRRFWTAQIEEINSFHSNMNISVVDVSAAFSFLIVYDFDDIGMDAGMNLEQAIAKRLAELCEEHNYTLDQLSYASGISLQTIRKIADGQQYEVSLFELLRICNVFGINLKDFFDKAY